MNDLMLPDRLNRLRRPLLIAGAVLVLLCVLVGFANPAQFFRSSLLACVFWIGFPLGCTGILMLHHLTGGAWGIAIRPTLEAASRTLPLMMLLLAPVLLLGTHALYEWSHAEALQDEVLRHKAAYLNVPFFLTRTAIYFAVWLLLSWLLNHWSLEQQRRNDPYTPHKLRVISGPGLVIFAITVSFASFDWMMSLEPHWQSTIYGMLWMAGQGLSALALSILVVLLLSREPSLSRRVRVDQIHDLGNLTLAFVMLWAYMSFSQWLIIWSGNLPEETPWYLRRISSGWGSVALLLILLHFALPFFLLLSRRTKRTPGVLFPLVVAILVMRFVDMFWTLVPAFHPDGFRLHWMDLAAPLGVGALWASAFLWQLGRRTLMPPYDALAGHPAAAAEVS